MLTRLVSVNVSPLVCGLLLVLARLVHLDQNAFINTLSEMSVPLPGAFVCCFSVSAFCAPLCGSNCAWMLFRLHRCNKLHSCTHVCLLQPNEYCRRWLNLCPRCSDGHLAGQMWGVARQISSHSGSHSSWVADGEPTPTLAAGHGTFACKLQMNVDLCVKVLPHCSSHSLVAAA